MKDKQISCTFSGNADTALKLSVFDDDDNGVIRDYKKVDNFSNQIRIDCKL